MLRIKLVHKLSKKNTRFQYKLVKKGGRAAEFENALEWLTLSGIVSRVYKAEQIKKPLENYKNTDSFKVYVSDMGLKDALYLLENEGYKVTFKGSGRVASQTPAAGTALGQGQKITLILK